MTTAAAATPRIDAADVGLDVAVVEDLLIALVDREDVAGPDERARLLLSRRAVELEVSRHLAA